MEYNLADLWERVVDTVPEREAFVCGDRRLTYAQADDRIDRLAHHLLDHGVGAGDRVALYLHNGTEYLEGMLAAFKIRAVPVNVNFRYVEDELAYLLTDADARAVISHREFAPKLAAIRDRIPPALHLVVEDSSPGDASAALADLGAVEYEAALAASRAGRDHAPRSADDLYILYTGGTTGMPKGVLWRNADANVECFGGSRADTLAGIVAEATGGLKSLLAPPFMHGAGHWVSFRTWNGGGTVYVQSVPERLDPVDVWSLIERERLNFLLIVGDAFGRPLLDELDRNTYDLSCLTLMLSGGAPLSAGLKEEFLRHLPTMMVIDGLGSSEAGGQLSQVAAAGNATTGTFPISPGNHVLSDDLSRELPAGDPEIGWLAKSGRLALGYLGDPAKTARTYPVVQGTRYAIPGDRARLRLDGLIELHGRDSVTINSGGEKIFAEEVEAAIKAHEGVYDCVVAGRPSERWGNEVVAIVRVREGYTVDEAALLAEAERHIARYKLPKQIIFVSEVLRSPSGKADYRWAKALAAQSQ